MNPRRKTPESPFVVAFLGAVCAGLVGFGMGFLFVTDNGKFPGWFIGACLGAIFGAAALVFFFICQCLEVLSAGRQADSSHNETS